MRMFVGSTGGASEYIEVTESELIRAKKLLASKPLPEILAELETSMSASKQEVNKQLSNMEARHGGALRSAEAAVNQARYDLQLADNDLKDAVSASKYSEAPAIEARKVELNQAILTAELALAHTQQAVAIERVQLLDSLANGQHGTGAELNGLQYNVIAQITRGIVYEWLTQKMNVDVSSMTRGQYEQAKYAVQDARASVQDASNKLKAYKKAATDKYSGAGVRAAAAEIKPPPPARPGQGGYPNWGSY